MKNRSTPCFSFRLIVICLVASASSLLADRWTWHTFPGLGHYENEGPWSAKPFQGSDRSEWISGFGLSPVLADGHETPFMLMATDLGPAIYNTTGERWVPADLPFGSGIAVGFDPHDGNTGYVLAYKTFEQATRSLLYRTRDRGRSWEFLTGGTYYRGQRNLITVDPDPQRAEHIYLATIAGVKRSLDDGQTWSVMPESEEMEIRTLRFNADGSSLFIVDESLNLYRADYTDASGDYTWTLVRSQGCRDVHPHPSDPERGLILDRFRNLYWSEDRGAMNGQDITPPFRNNKEYVLINPGEPDHLLAMGKGRINFSYHWSRDAGQPWQAMPTENIDGTTYFPGITDYSPFNHGSTNSWMFDRFDTMIEGTRHLFGFWPGIPERVIQWSTNKPKIALLSEDWGATYRPFSYGGLYKEGTMLALGTSDDVMVLSRLEQGLVDTANGGLWWRGSSPHNVPIIGEIQVEGDHAASWTTSTMHGIAIDPEDDTHWIGVYGNGPAWIVRTRDGGASWERVLEIDLNLATSSQDFTRRWVYWHPQEPDIIYAASQKSTDRGLTWQPLPNGFGVSEMSSQNGDLIIYRNFGRYHVSIDAGETWHELPTARSPTFARYELVNGRSPGMVAFDPDPARDPAVEGQFFRFIVGGRGGIFEYQATNQDGSQGVWTRLTEGLVLDDDPWVRDGVEVYFTHTTFDPRPGQHHIAYAAAGKGFSTPSKLGVFSGCNSHPGKGNEPSHPESSLGLIKVTI